MIQRCEVIAACYSMAKFIREFKTESKTHIALKTPLKTAYFDYLGDRRADLHRAFCCHKLFNGFMYSKRACEQKATFYRFPVFITGICRTKLVLRFSKIPRNHSKTAKQPENRFLISAADGFASKIYASKST
ncbi:hypothetical protein L596_028274 [Steinernema carpocapsae]|uniref:Uncharacterized protein n=1 Tax=Steinernema carpocapsae TaxID=34508 RepID=A0A4U5LXY7_STECR|nr:hypothetical protein L596_028274 [Steinernema carpocapsae]